MALKSSLRHVRLTLSLGLLCGAGAVHAEPASYANPAITVRSPQPSVAHEDDTGIYRACGSPDRGLQWAAQHSLHRQLRGEGAWGPGELLFTLRTAGSPYVWPRSWSVSGSPLDAADASERAARWADKRPTVGKRRCGVAQAITPEGKTIITAVSVDALADLDPLPVQARTGQWISLTGQMNVPADAVRVILLGPRGAPKTVLSSLSKGRIRSTFSVDQPGGWLIQIVADVATGPRPVAETMIYADATPPTSYVPGAAPGEQAGAGAPDRSQALRRMVNAARAAEGLEDLTPSRELDALALEHTRAMIEARTVGHDVGQGNPISRIQDAGVAARVAGENAASAQSVVGAHRALWASPSHRGNLLSNRYRKMGLAVLEDARGRVWATQLFTD